MGIKATIMNRRERKVGRELPPFTVNARSAGQTGRKKRRTEMNWKYVLDKSFNLIWRIFLTIVLVYMFREYFAPAFEAIWSELSFALNSWTHHRF